MRKSLMLLLLTLLSPVLPAQQFMQATNSVLDTLERINSLYQTQVEKVYIVTEEQAKAIVLFAENLKTKNEFQAASISSLSSTVATQATKIDELQTSLDATNVRLLQQTAQVKTLNDQLAAAQAQIVSLQQQLANAGSGGSQPLPGTIQMAIPPLQYNSGSWSNAGTTTIVNGVLVDRLSQTAQTTTRVLRRDFGIDDPNSGGFIREPKGKLRNYFMKITIPADYKPVNDMNNWWQWHTSSAKMSPYLSFFGWTSTTRWRHIKPDATFVDYNTQPYKLGHTYDCQVQAKWSQGQDGILRVWEDGVKIIDYSGPTFRADEVDAPYILFGQYQPSVSAAFDNTVIFSDFRITD